MSSINSPVLVLNRHWTPLTVIPAIRAIGMLFSERAHVVDPDDYATYDFESWSDLSDIFDGKDCIHTSSLAIPIPDVLLLKSAAQPKFKKVTFTRRNLLKRDRKTCQYCGDKVSNRTFTIDHILPTSRGGKTTFPNCVVACRDCNCKKDNNLPHEVGMALLNKPKEPPKRKITYSVEILSKKISWAKFIKDPSMRDEVASVVYWNSGLKD